MFYKGKYFKFQAAHSVNNFELFSVIKEFNMILISSIFYCNNRHSTSVTPSTFKLNSGTGGGLEQTVVQANPFCGILTSLSRVAEEQVFCDVV
jgi:hypothetical protein